MKNINIIDENGIEIEILVTNSSTIKDICNRADVLEFFGMDEGEEDIVMGSISSINDTHIDEALRAFVVDSTVVADGRYTFDLEAEDEDEDEDDYPTEDEPAVNTDTIGNRGVVAVETSAGLQSTNIAIIIGESTVHDAIYTDQVMARSGMTQVQLSSCVIMLNDEEVTQEDSHTKTLNNGDVISLNNRAVSTKSGR